MSETIDIAKTKYSPRIYFSPEEHLLLIEGQSYPENAFAFYQPLLEKLEQYLGESPKDNLKVTLKLVYINTSSFKIILDVMDMLDEAFQKRIASTRRLAL